MVVARMRVGLFLFFGPLPVGARDLDFRRSVLGFGV